MDNLPIEIWVNHILSLFNPKELIQLLSTSKRLYSIIMKKLHSSTFIEKYHLPKKTNISKFYALDYFIDSTANLKFINYNDIEFFSSIHSDYFMSKRENSIILFLPSDIGNNLKKRLLCNQEYDYSHNRKLYTQAETPNYVIFYNPYRSQYNEIEFIPFYPQGSKEFPFLKIKWKYPKERITFINYHQGIDLYVVGAFDFTDVHSVPPEQERGRNIEPDFYITRYYWGTLQDLMNQTLKKSDLLSNWNCCIGCPLEFVDRDGFLVFFHSVDKKWNRIHPVDGKISSCSIQLLNDIEMESPYMEIIDKQYVIFIIRNLLSENENSQDFYLLDISSQVIYKRKYLFDHFKVFEMHEEVDFTIGIQFDSLDIIRAGEFITVTLMGWEYRFLIQNIIDYISMKMDTLPSVQRELNKICEFYTNHADVRTGTPFQKMRLKTDHQVQNLHSKTSKLSITTLQNSIKFDCQYASKREIFSLCD